MGRTDYFNLLNPANLLNSCSMNIIKLNDRQLQLLIIWAGSNILTKISKLGIVIIFPDFNKKSYFLKGFCAIENEKFIIKKVRI